MRAAVVRKVRATVATAMRAAVTRCSLAPNEAPFASDAVSTKVVLQLAQAHPIHTELRRERVEERVQLVRHVRTASVVLPSALEKLASQQADDALTVLGTWK